jgi:hypothetical protein
MAYNDKQIIVFQIFGSIACFTNELFENEYLKGLVNLYTPIRNMATNLNNYCS